MPTQRKLIVTMLFAFSAVSALPVFAQEPSQPAEPPSTGWRRFGEPAPEQRQQQADQAPPQSMPMPSSGIVVPAGNWGTVRGNQPLPADPPQQGGIITAN